MTVSLHFLLCQLLKVLSDKKNSHIITWMPSGKSFNILKPKAFVGVILPEHFKTAKYSSFTRKLHRWGFVRHYRGEEAGAFYHKDFQRDRLDLVEKMTCHKAEAPKSAAPVQKEAAEKLAAAKVVGRKQPSPTQVAKKPETPLVTAQAPAKPCESKTAMLSLSQQQRAQPALPVHTERFNAQQLNAAIEFEVARRLRERINSVALSRQAFAISTLRQQQLGPSTGQLAALLLKKQNGELSNNTPLNFSQRGYRALASNGQPSAPETNIQGARTA